MNRSSPPSTSSSLAAERKKNANSFVPKFVRFCFCSKFKRAHMLYICHRSVYVLSCIVIQKKRVFRSTDFSRNYFTRISACCNFFMFFYYSFGPYKKLRNVCFDYHRTPIPQQKKNGRKTVRHTIYFCWTNVGRPIIIV